MNGQLSSAKVRTLSQPGSYADGNGLYLQVRSSGKHISKSWIFRYMRNGKSRNMGLGPIRLVPLAEARDHALTAQRQLYHGVDPIQARRKKQAEKTAPLFREASATYIAIHTPTWKNKKHVIQWSNTLERYAYPVIGDIPVIDVTRSQIIEILKPIWLSKSETATRVRGRIEKVLDWSKAEGHFEGENPATWKGNLEHSLPKRPSKERTRHLAALPWRELPDFYQRLIKQDGMAATALRFTILTAARTTEVRLATSSEFEAELWTVPAIRMKAGVEHRVPLSPETLSVVRLGSKDSTYLFSPFPEKELSENAMLALLRRMKMNHVTVHGFRSTFRDWAADSTETPREIIEACLAHSNPNQVEAAYLRTDVLVKRSALMERWSVFVSGK